MGRTLHKPVIASKTPQKYRRRIDSQLHHCKIQKALFVVVLKRAADL